MLAILLGTLLGSAATYYLSPRPQTARFAKLLPADRPVAPELSVAEAEVLREESYQSIRTVAETLALPTDFAETEALYALAGRSNSAGIQDLIYEAAGIRERTDRRAALGILFLRLTELDPRSALAIARSPAFAVEPGYERDVWLAWGRLDLSAALRAAENGSSAEKYRAAQALYASVRGLRNEASDLIHSTLGILPGRGVQAQHLYALADRSPVDAIRYIESLNSEQERREHFGWLAMRLSRSGLVNEADYAGLIRSPAHRRLFEQGLAAQKQRSDPEAVVAEVLNGSLTPESMNQAFSALHRLATQDPARAIELLDQLPDSHYSRRYKASVVAAIARSDPDTALAWARDNDSSADQATFIGVLSEIANHHPMLAFAEAQGIENAVARDRVITAVAMSIGQSNPTEAMQIVDQIGNERMRENSIGQLAAVWAQSDLDSAMNWVASLQAGARNRALQAMGQNLAYADVDKAISLLDRFPEGNARGLAMQVADNLTRVRGVDAALTFIERYKGRTEYERLQSAVIGTAANSDPERAMHLARSIENGPARDRLYAQIIGRQAARDPQKALQWMNAIADESARTTATSQLVMAWMHRDASAAMAWVESLPNGSTRDDAIVSAAGTGPSDASLSGLISSINDPVKRQQATILHIQVLSRTDPDAAERLMNEADFSPEDRAQVEQFMNRSFRHFD